MEDEDPTPASSTPPPITMDSFRTASPLVCAENRDPDDDGDDLDDDDDDAGEDEEEKTGEAERRNRDNDRHSSHSPSPMTSPKSPDPALALGASIPKPTPQLAAPATSGREDCWSEGATWVLIEAWGERHLRSQAEPQSHQRGGLRQKDWEEVAEAVASRGGEGKQAKSEGQCKNRIDTLKKKYKVERLKQHSSWPYFQRLNDLLAADYEDGGGHGNGLSSKLPAGVGFGSFRHQLQQLQMKKKKRTTKKRSHRQLLQSVKPPPFLSPSPPRQGKEDDSSDGLPPTNGKSGKKTGRKGLPLVGLGPTRLRLATKGVARPEAGLRELAHAVMRLSEVYERVENTKLRQAEELEKRRMGLAKELEVQRMDFFMKTLVEVTQSNHKKSKQQSTPDTTENHTAATGQVAAANAGGHRNKSSDSGEMK